MKTNFVYLLSILALLLGHHVSAQNTSTYRLVARQNNHSDVVSISNEVNLSDPIKIQIPNAFSPDGDFVNDFFQVKGIGIDAYSIRIYDRWGKLIFESQSLDRPWDGTYKGKPAQQGVYTFQITAENVEFGINRTFSNTLTLIR